MAFNQDVLVNKLLAAGVIARTEIRGRYTVDGETGTFRRNDLIRRFALEVEPNRYLLNSNARRAIETIQLRRAQAAAQARAEQEARTRRRLTQRSYHSGDRSGFAAALESIPVDEDGVRRSFGIEYEVYALNADQEDKLARLLDTLPMHIVEHDGSLDPSGCEIVFAPVGADEYVRIVETLARFVRENDVAMASSYGSSMAGMHTTYGVSNAEATRSDLQIRLNRFAFAVMAAGTQGQIKRLFGRHFGQYRELPQSTTTDTHSNAFSTHGRPQTCWECRLPSWECNPRQMVKFFAATEGAFHHPVNAEDFVKVFEVLGGNTEQI